MHDIQLPFIFTDLAAVLALKFLVAHIPTCFAFGALSRKRARENHNPRSCINPTFNWLRKYLKIFLAQLFPESYKQKVHSGVKLLRNPFSLETGVSRSSLAYAIAAVQNAERRLQGRKG